MKFKYNLMILKYVVMCAKDIQSPENELAKGQYRFILYRCHEGGRH